MKHLGLLSLALVLAFSSFAQETMKPSSTPLEGKYTYTMEMNMGGQEMAFDTQRTIKEDGDKVIITDRTATPMGTNESIVTLNKATLETISSESSGFQTMRLTYTDGKISGESSDFQGNKTPIDIDVDGTVYGNPDLLIPNLPLKEGYEATIKSFNPQAMQVVNTYFKVEGKEKIEVGAGTFDAYKVVMTYPDSPVDVKIISWVKADAPSYPIKSEVVLPQGTMTTTLSKMKEAKK